ncbi:MAG: hypothetical protein JW991_05125 [Candidatus Pacebacteria bacterium]|nr:hypothetical protein [Candidatus Paceibacterota bacterium]
MIDSIERSAVRPPVWYSRKRVSLYEQTRRQREKEKAERDAAKRARRGSGREDYQAEIDAATLPLDCVGQQARVWIIQSLARQHPDYETVELVNFLLRGRVYYDRDLGSFDIWDD